MLNRFAFTLLELIFTIVIIGVLASVAIPKFTGLSDNAKISSELSTAASVQVAIDTCHGEWIINEGSFTCGGSIDSSELNSYGYPASLGSAANPLDKILKKAPTGWSLSGARYTGPASNVQNGASTCKADKPCKDRHWEYDAVKGTFSLKDN